MAAATVGEGSENGAGQGLRRTGAPGLTEARAVLRRLFGYPDFRPGQDELVLAVLAGRDALGILPTGGGKSVCYQVPSVLLPGPTLVVSPLISLMADQVERSRGAGLRAALLNSALSPAEAMDVTRRALAGELSLLFVAPERFDSPAFARILPSLGVALLAVDEAHCIAEWGHDFRPAYLRLGRLRSVLGCPVLALTATATPRVRREIVERLGLRRPVRIVQSFDRANLVWGVRRCATPALKARHLRDEVAAVERGSTIVYASSRKGVEALRDLLAGHGLPTEAYHAGLPPEERERVQSGFMDGTFRRVVATNAFGMGIDKSDVRLVAHYELPRTLEAYYQEAGRAGRDGAGSSCVAFTAPGDRALQQGFIDRTHPPASRVRRIWRVLRRLGPGTRSRSELMAALRGRGVLLAPEALDSALRVLAEAGCVLLPGPGGGSGSPREGTRVHLGRGSLRLAGVDLRRPREMRKLASVFRYAATRRCRRRVLLAYFGERRPGRRHCGCDNCARGGRSGYRLPW